MAEIKLLLVDDELSQRELLSGYLSKNGFDVKAVESGESALELYPSFFSPIALIDMKMPGMDGLELLIKLKEINPFVQVLMLTAFGSVETAVSAMRDGAFDYLTKPIEELDELKIKLVKAAKQNRLVLDHQVLTERMAEIYPDTEIIGNSKSINQVNEMIARVGPSDATVLITGASGTGKELVARAIHAVSTRGTERLVAINCAAFPENLLESELFGYEKGAFTGADKLKQGRFELAQGGSLFLDEIGEMPLSMQVKLLRVLEDHKVERLGSINEIDLDIRLIAATNRNLEQLVEEKKFREDLFYRLNVVRIDIPPLKERAGDILLLTEKFIDKFKKKIGKDIKGVDKEAAKILTNYHWPGNVRELENVIERAIVLSYGDFITSEELSGLKSISTESGEMTELTSLASLEKMHIEKTLKKLNWSISKTADLLEIHRNTLRMKMKEYKISKPQ
jgi:DNA-binding NtrC family response regulator